MNANEYNQQATAAATASGNHIDWEIAQIVKKMSVDELVAFGNAENHKRLAKTAEYGRTDRRTLLDARSIAESVIKAAV